MTRVTPIIVYALCAGACASSSSPSSTDSSITADPVLPSQVEEPAVAEDPTMDGADEGIEVIDVPAVAKAEVKKEDPRKDERICRREVRTGTHRAVRVCRTRAEIEQMELESKDTFRDLHRSQRTQDMAESGKRL